MHIFLDFTEKCNLPYLNYFQNWEITIWLQAKENNNCVLAKVLKNQMALITLSLVTADQS